MRARSRWVVVAAAGLLVAVLTVSTVVLVDLVRDDSPGDDDTRPVEVSPAPSVSANPTDEPPPRRSRLDGASDPAAYATAVATALLTWDTTFGPGPLEHAQPVLLDGDPTGREMTGLLRDVTGHLPTDEQWAILRRAETRQRVAIHRTTVPTTWPAVHASAADQLPAGTTAVTVHATRHRTGRWDGQPRSSDHPITFTVFMACPPPDGSCHVLRLSRPDQPLP